MPTTVDELGGRRPDDPARFAEDLLEGFLDAHSDRVGVPGGVVRAEETPAGKVAVGVGGGSGHYPAFCGVVGPCFADGAVVGNIVTPPLGIPGEPGVSEAPLPSAAELATRLELSLEEGLARDATRG